MALKSSEMESNLYVIPSLHAKNVVCRSNGVSCGQYKDKEGKTLKKVKKCPKTSKMIALKNIFPKN